MAAHWPRSAPGGSGPMHPCPAREQDAERLAHQRTQASFDEEALDQDVSDSSCDTLCTLFTSGGLLLQGVHLC